MKSKVVIAIDGTNYLQFYCPGCDCLENIPFKAGTNYDGPVWTYTGSEEHPSITPSVRHFFPAHDNIREETTCHYYLSNGVIKFCGDCKHSLNGKEVPLIEIPEKYI